MSKALFIDIFDNLGGSLTGMLANSVLEECHLDIENRSLKITVNSPNYVSRQAQLEVAAVLRESLKLENLTAEYLFS
ncbi:MAG: hypothetical protein IJZ63_03340, partial [Clostridia bacterium]|nr:hypothetical protein [Clostridia bacterium]